MSLFNCDTTPLPNPGGRDDGYAEKFTRTVSEADSKECVRGARLDSGQVRPLYGSYCFSSIPGLIEKTILGTTDLSCPSWLNAQALGSFNRVVFMFFDAFGWESFERFRGSTPVLKRFEKEGLVLQTTSQFPSTTAVHVTTAVTGRDAHDHGVCGWDYYEPAVGKVIRPLKLQDSADPDSRSLHSLGFSPEQVLPRGNFLQRLLAGGSTVQLHGPEAFFPSSFTTPYISPLASNGYNTIEKGFSNVAEQLRSSTGPTYQYLYIDAYDTICHKKGVGSNDADTVAREILSQLSHFVERDRYGDTLLVLSADHGQIADRFGCSLRLQEVFPEVERYLKRAPSGELIRFSGGARYLFLHVTEEAIPTVVNELSRKLQGAATVVTAEELAQLGFLGPLPVQEPYLERLGNVAILPHPGYSVSWYEPPVFGKHEYSGHGGVSPQEMETPLLLLPLS